MLERWEKSRYRSDRQLESLHFTLRELWECRQLEQLRLGIDPFTPRSRDTLRRTQLSTSAGSAGGRAGGSAGSASGSAGGGTCPERARRLFESVGEMEAERAEASA